MLAGAADPTGTRPTAVGQTGDGTSGASGVPGGIAGSGYPTGFDDPPGAGGVPADDVTAGGRATTPSSPPATTC